MSIPNFRKLKEGDKISATEWNALVDMVFGVSRSSMTDGIITPHGFYPRKRLLPSRGADPIIMLHAPVDDPPPTLNPGFDNVLDWKYYLSTFQSNFEVEENRQNIVVRKTGLYEFHLKFYADIFYPPIGYGWTSSSAFLEIYKSGLGIWDYGTNANPIAHCMFAGKFTVGGTIVSFADTLYMEGTTYRFLEANTKVRVNMYFLARDGMTFKSYSPSQSLAITYRGDITPQLNPPTSPWNPFGYG